jgi:predicted ferric reductase
MPRYQSSFWLFLILISSLWFLADSLWPKPWGYFAFRNVFNQYSGILAICIMSLAMILAVRPAFLEKPMKGLDKCYRLHKWLGIGALVVATVHWWITKGTKWMVGWGWLERPERGGRPPADSLSTIEAFIRSQRGFAETVGEWAFYIVVAFIGIALIKRIPYSFFRSTHRWIALIYLGLVFHTVILVKADYWTQPIGIVLAVLLVGGTFSAVVSLFRKIGSSRKVEGRISHIAQQGDMLEATVVVPSKWPGHTPGQFAFVTSNAAEGPHPYTIASHWNKKRSTLRFFVKQLGDWTGQLPEYLTPNMPVTVEGPYGCFDFKDTSTDQIWIAGGVGITPFLAQLEALGEHSIDKSSITLLYSHKSDNSALLEQIQHAAALAKVHLVFKSSDQAGRFTESELKTFIKDPKSTSIWFCGPASFGDWVHQQARNAGIPNRHLHQELFEMR